MISKKIIAEIRALHQTKYRNDRQLFIAEGEKVVSELVLSGLSVRMIAGVSSIIDSLRVQLPDIDMFEISEAELLKISMLQSPNKVLAVAGIPKPEPVQLGKETGTLLLLDGIRDPGNMGTIIRTADWFGVKHIFCSEDCVDAFNPKVVQSAMGSLFRMHIHYGPLELVIDTGKKTGNFLVAGATAGGLPYKEFSRVEKVMLVIGSESHGIRENISGLLDIKSGIPKAPESSAESLNAAVACAILLAHFQCNAK